MTNTELKKINSIFKPNHIRMVCSNSFLKQNDFNELLLRREIEQLKKDNEFHIQLNKRLIDFLIKHNLNLIGTKSNNCKCCYVEYFPKRITSKFCSDKCRSSFHKKNNR